MQIVSKFHISRAYVSLMRNTFRVSCCTARVQEMLAKSPNITPVGAGNNIQRYNLEGYEGTNQFSLTQYLIGQIQPIMLCLYTRETSLMLAYTVLPKDTHDNLSKLGWQLQVGYGLDSTDYMPQLTSVVLGSHTTAFKPVSSTNEHLDYMSMTSLEVECGGFTESLPNIVQAIINRVDNSHDLNGIHIGRCYVADTFTKGNTI